MLEICFLYVLLLTNEAACNKHHETLSVSIASLAFMLSLLHWLVWIWKRTFLGC